MVKLCVRIKVGWLRERCEDLIEEKKERINLKGEKKKGDLMRFGGGERRWSY